MPSRAQETRQFRPSRPLIFWYELNGHGTIGIAFTAIIYMQYSLRSNPKGHVILHIRLVTYDLRGTPIIDWLNWGRSQPQSQCHGLGPG